MTNPVVPTAPDGLLIVDKPAGITSHDVVARARRICATRKIGHAGTLDPMATGVLLLGVGRATRWLTFLVGSDKDYVATIRLGQVTVTDDAEGEVVSARGCPDLDPGELAAAVASLTGDIEQIPSAVSAIKVGGVRSYAAVRAGESVELRARPVRVDRFEVGAPRPTAAGGIPVVDLDVEVTVSSGTFVRALARDLGERLGVGGHLISLRRTRSGAFTVAAAHDLAALRAAADAGEVAPVIPIAAAARATFVGRDLDAEQARAVSLGQRIPSAIPGRREPVAAFAPDGQLVAMLDESGPMARSHAVFAPASS